MNTTLPTAVQPPSRMVAGALAHLAKHMETGCQRSAYLAAMLLEQVANDGEADDHLRRHARELVEILDRDGDLGREQPTHETASARAEAKPRSDFAMGVF